MKRIITTAIASLAFACASTSGEIGKAKSMASGAMGAKQLIASYAAFNMRESLDLWADDCVLNQMGSPDEPSVFKGKDAINGFLGGFLKTFPDYKLAPVRVTQLEDNKFLVEAMYRGTNKGPMANGMPATGKEIGGTLVHLWTLDSSGKASQLDIYVGGMQTLQQLGVMPPMMGEIPPVYALPDAAPEIISGAGAEANVAVMKMLHASAYGSHDFSVYEKHVAADVSVGLPRIDKVSGLDGLKKDLARFWSAVSEEKISYTGVWARGDYVITLAEHEGLHSGDLGPMKATNKRFTRPFVNVAKLKDGKVVHMTAYSNALGAMKQLGLYPPKAPPTSAADQPSTVD